MRRLIATRLASALAPALVAGLALVAGCNGPAAGSSHDALAQLPDCALVNVDVDFQAEPGHRADTYIVHEGTVPVCTTDFAGLESLAARADGLAPLPFLRVSPASSNPMPGRGEDPADDPAASNPMPGRGEDPAASNPMPGRGEDPAASNPMPGRDPNTLAVVQAAYTR